MSCIWVEAARVKPQTKRNITMQRTLTTRTEKALAIVSATIILAGLSLAVNAASLRWDQDGVTNDWNDSDANWYDQDLGTFGHDYDDGDHASFISTDSGSSGTDDGEAVFIGSAGTPADVTPASTSILGHHGGTWTFSGGDIKGAGSLTHDSNRPTYFYQDDLSFSGGTYITGRDNGHFYFQPSSSGTETSHQLGSGRIYLHQQNTGFTFTAGDAVDHLTNNFEVQSGQTGRWIYTDNGGVLDGTLYLGGTLNLPKASRTLDLPVSLTSNDATLAHSNNSGQRTINADIDGQGIYELTLDNAQTGNPDWRLHVDDGNVPAGGWDIAQLTVTGNGSGATQFDVDETDFFDTLTGNGGGVTVDGGSVEFLRSNTVAVEFDLQLNSGMEGFHNNDVLNVQNDGSLSGDGTLVHMNGYHSSFDQPVTVNVGDNGTVAPGTSTGTLTVTGDATFNAGSTLIIELGGSSPGISDLLDVSGILSIASDAGNPTTLDLRFANGYEMGMFGDSFDVLNWGSVSGEFDTVSMPSLPYGFLRWETDELYTTGLITAIPEPASGILLLLTAPLLLRRRR